MRSWQLFVGVGPIALALIFLGVVVPVPEAASLGGMLSLLGSLTVPVGVMSSGIDERRWPWVIGGFVVSPLFGTAFLLMYS
jgi:hypothetical protein